MVKRHILAADNDPKTLAETTTAGTANSVCLPRPAPASAETASVEVHTNAGRKPWLYAVVVAGTLVLSLLLWLTRNLLAQPGP